MGSNSRATTQTGPTYKLLAPKRRHLLHGKEQAADWCPKGSRHTRSHTARNEVALVAHVPEVLGGRGKGHKTGGVGGKRGARVEDKRRAAGRLKAEAANPKDVEIQSKGARAALAKASANHGAHMNHRTCGGDQQSVSAGVGVLGKEENKEEVWFTFRSNG